MPKDPICGMNVDAASAIKLVSGRGEYFFCGTHCKDKFIKQEGITGAVKACLPQRPGVFFKDKLFIISAIALLLVVASFFLPLLVPFRKAFLGYLKAIWWAVLLGFGLGGVIDYYVPREYISKTLSQKRPRTIFNAVFLGFLMSACSHGILALSIQLYKKGASGPAVVSFLLASPWANFTITVMLISLFGAKGLFIVLAALVVALNTGFIFMFLENAGLIEKNAHTAVIEKDFSVLGDFKRRVKSYKFSVKGITADLAGVIRGSSALAEMVLWWVVLGVLIASFTGAYIPVHFFHRFMGPTFLGLLVTLALATVIEVCSEGSSPLAFEIYKRTGALGNSFVFLMAGVVTDYTEIGLLWTNVGRRTAIWLVIVSVPQVIAIGYIANIIFR